MPLTLKVDSLCKKYGRRFVVDNFSFEVEQGDLYGFLGPNGAGKTTTLSVLAGLIKPTSGRFEYFGKTASLKESKKDIGFVIESPSFYDYLTARQNLKLFLRFYDGIKKNHEMEIIETVGLSNFANVKVGTFSQGMKQRLWIGQALISNPKLLILDEPTNGLDPEGNYEVWSLLRKLVRERGATILISSHLLTEIEEGCNKACIISEGKKIASGSVAELLANQTGDIEIEIEKPDFDKIDAYFISHPEIDITSKKRLENLYCLKISSKNIEAAKLNYELNSAGFSVRSFRLMKKTLKEYFLDITSNNDERKAPK